MMNWQLAYDQVFHAFLDINIGNITSNMTTVYVYGGD